VSTAEGERLTDLLANAAYTLVDRVVADGVELCHEDPRRLEGLAVGLSMVSCVIDQLGELAEQIGEATKAKSEAMDDLAAGLLAVSMAKLAGEVYNNAVFRQALLSVVQSEYPS
jgi:light-regulated signal transduction histidine kinase (bacteriophytochrome)